MCDVWSEDTRFVITILPCIRPITTVLKVYIKTTIDQIKT